MPKENATFCKKKPLERRSFFNQDDMLTHIIQKDLTKNASGQITDHYDLPQNPSVLSW